VNNLKMKGHAMTTTETSNRLGSDVASAGPEVEEPMNIAQHPKNDRPAQFRHRLAGAFDSAKTTYHRVQDKTVAAAKATDKQIHEHPYRALGVALALGLVTGWCTGYWTSRRRSS
jgi:ElaB/YqjD/DUF883 family membrane-anchored ribosome-binding protein